MSNMIEERILEMRFNNTDFEKKANQSINTLDRLDRGLQLNNGNAFEALSSIMGVVSNKFSILGTVGDQVIRTLTNKVMGLAGQFVNLAKSMSVDQIAAGWNKYGEKTSAVQTIMAATAKDWQDTGKQMEYVNGQLEKLNWFTDETSYSFLDMVNNIGKFTSNGIKLEDATTAMEGISTWAAISGANVNEAGRAMYNLSQAMATGTVKLIDWKSIENANMATREFKDTVLDNAVALGTLTKEADGSFKTLQNHVFTAAQFNTQLSDGWFSSEVLMKTLNQYGAFSDKLQEAANATDYTATELLQAIQTYKETGEVIPELSGYVKELSKSEYDLGLRAFKAAQEAKTFKEAIDATKDAVSTGWMNTFETIFGNYQEAKELWTGLANGLYDIFAEGGNERNRILKEWRNFPMEMRKGIIKAGLEEWEGPFGKEGAEKFIDGREILLQGVTNIASSLVSVLDTIKGAFRDIFPQKTAKDLIGLTYRFKYFTESLKPSEETLSKLGRILKGVFAIFDIGKMAVSGLAKLFMKSLFPSIKSIGGSFFDATANLGDWIVGLRDSIKENDIFGKKVKSLSEIIAKVIGWFNTAKNTFTNFFNKLFGIKEGLTIWERLGEVLSKIGKVASTAVSAVRSFFSTLFGGEKLGASGLIKVMGGLLASFLGFKKIQGIGKDSPLESLIETLKGGAKKVFEKFAEGLDSIGSAIDSFKKKSDSETLRNIAISLLILAAAMAVLANIDAAKLGKALVAVAIGLGELVGAFKLLGMAGTVGNKSASILIKLAAAILILSIAISILSKIETSDLVKGLIAVAAVIGIVIGALYLLNKFAKKASTLKAAGAAMIGIAIAMLIMVGAVALFGLIPTDKLIKGIASIAAVLLIVSGALILLSRLAKPGAMLAAAASILVISAALLIMVGAIALMSFIPVEQMKKTLLGLGAALLAISLILVVLSKIARPGQLLAAAASILLVAAAVAVLAVSISALALVFMMNQDAALTAMISFGIMLGALVIAIIALGATGPMAIVGAAALLIVAVAMAVASAAILILATAINMLVGLPIAAIAGGLALLGLAMIPLGVGGLIAGLGIVGYAGLLVLGLSLNMLEGLHLAKIAGGLSLLGLAMIPLGVGGLILGLGAAGMIVGSLGIAALGVAMLPLSLGLKALEGVSQESILKFLEVLAISVAALAGLGVIAEAFSIGLLALGAACLEVGGGIALAGEGLEKIVNSLGNIPSGSAKAISELASGVAKAVKESRGTAKEEVEGMISDMKSAIESNTGEIVSSAENLSQALIDAFNSKTSEITTRFSSSIATALKRIQGYYGQYYNAGYNLAKGVANGVRAGQWIAVEAVTTMSQEMINKLKDLLGIHSPSVVFANLAEYIPAGIARGIDKSSNLATGSIESLCRDMSDALVPAMSILDGIVKDEFNISPTIRPVVDLSEIRASSSQINSFLGRDSVYARELSGGVYNQMVSVEARKAAISGFIDSKNMDSATMADMLVVTNAILKAVQNGHDIFFDDGELAGRINRRFGAQL